MYISRWSRPLNVLSVFSGVAGIELGMGLANQIMGREVYRLAACCEIEPYPVQVLRKRYPGVPIHGDITTLTRDALWYRYGIGGIDMLCGGFPCQDLSCAGKQTGLEGDRSGLWFEMLRLVQELRPRWVLAENVRNAVNLALDTCRVGLEDEGYTVRPFVLPASYAGAPHERNRLFIVAYSCCS
jgi:DNA (cytosine-5)-methyltransferase 1